jgi:Flp pilus assembly protein TadG
MLLRRVNLTKMRRPERRVPLRADLLQNREGLAAVEFGLLALPFILFISAIIEIALMLIMNLNLSNAIATVSRQIRVGSLQAPGISQTTTIGSRMSLTDFKALVCSKIVFIGTNTCQSGLQLDVRTLSTFQGSPTSPITGQTFDTTGFCFYSGAPGSVVQIRAYFLWPLINPLLWNTLTNISTSKTSLGTTTGHWMGVSTTNVFVNEPNASATNTGAQC